MRSTGIDQPISEISLLSGLGYGRRGSARWRSITPMVSPAPESGREAIVGKSGLGVIHQPR
jgi:hypothetical protein